MKNNSVRIVYIGKFVKNIPSAHGFPSRRIGISRNSVSSRPEGGIAFPRHRYIRIVDLFKITNYIRRLYDISRVTIIDLINRWRRIVFSNSIGESWMARTARRGRRPQRLPKIVVERASQQLGFMSPINSCDFADRFSDLESRLPIFLSLSFLSLSPSLLPAPLSSFYPSAPTLSFLTGTFRHSAGSSPPTKMNPSWLRSVCYLLSSEISRSICYHRGWILCERSRSLPFIRLLYRQEQKSRYTGIPLHYFVL